MAVTFTDQEIIALMGERKTLPTNWPAQINLRQKLGHKECFIDIAGESGSDFRLILRQNRFIWVDFSIILTHRIPQSNQLFRLRRCNGKSHPHTNHIEGVSFYDFHIHMATERYQSIGSREDTYAEVTAEYSDFAGALNCMLRDGNFVFPPSSQMGLL